MKEDRSGSKPKVQVTDVNGMLWTAKFPSKSRTGTEVHAEIADTLVFCHGLDASPPLSVPLEHAQWLSVLASQLNQAQVRRAFEASGAEPRDIDGFSTLVMTRVAQLRAAIDGKDDETSEGCS